MRIWLVTVSEPLPCDRHSVRLCRTGLLAHLLVEQGHDVVWWTSTFDHSQKRRRFHGDTFLSLGPRYKMALLDSIPYRRNISVARLINHRGIARKFRRYARYETPPEIILCSFPTIELSLAAVDYGQQTGIPVILDVRDPWPDLFLNILPSRLHWLGRAALYKLTAETRSALKRATGIVAMSEACLRWGLEYAQRDPGPYDAIFPLAYPRPKADEDQLRMAAAAMSRHGVDARKLICWFVGSFGNVYDLTTVIQVARELARRDNREVQFVLSGDGDQRVRWMDQARGLENVVFTGWVDVHQIAYLMTIADIGLVALNGVPSALPNKLFEYFAAGLPVLASLQGEGAALLQQFDCGFIYKAGDPNSLLEALERLAQDEVHRRRMGANALALYEDRFTVGAVYPRMIELLVDITRRPSGGMRVSSQEGLLSAGGR
jgi:glycosyltransferase involved in cell wall biosynthesis